MVTIGSQHKYARIERERRFLLNWLPDEMSVVETRRITDRYIDGTTLRLRKLSDATGASTFKLTQKKPSPASGAQQGFITTMYLTADEYRIFAELPAKQLTKIRYTVPPFGVDVFENELAGLIVAEAEFDSAVDADALELPSFISSEVSADIRFTGGQLVHASRNEVLAWLAEYGMRPRVDRGSKDADLHV